MGEEHVVAARPTASPPLPTTLSDRTRVKNEFEGIERKL
jgi:hypothetical protein